MGHSSRKEAWEIVEAVREADRAYGETTLGQVCACGIVTLDVGCYHCARRGRYRVTRLIDQHGAETTLLKLKDILAADCPKRGGSFFNQCGAYFPGLAARIKEPP